MNATDPELQQFVDGVRRSLRHQVDPIADPDTEKSVAKIRAIFAEVDVLSLAVDTADLNDSLNWLTATVTEIAAVTPSLAFALAAHYTACRVTLASGDAARAGLNATAGVLPAQSTAVVPTVLDPAVVVLLGPAPDAGMLADPTAIAPTSSQRSFSGLRGAELREVQATVGQVCVEVDHSAAAAALRDWQLLCAAALLGVADSSLARVETYTAQRRQFGSALSSFAAVRAMLADMRVRCERLRALLLAALDGTGSEIAWRSVAAEAGRTAVGVALDAIQLHGGYGYVEEYPVARHLRDAMSISARSGARRTVLAGIAVDRLGDASGVTR